MQKKLRPEFCHSYSVLGFFSSFSTAQVKIQIFFQCLCWRLFCSAPFHSSLWHRADAFHTEQRSLGLQWKRRREKSLFCGMRRDCWQLVKSLWARTELCKPVSQQAALMRVCGSTHVPVPAVRDEDVQTYRLRSTPCLWCHPSFSHRFPLSPLPQMSTQDRRKCFLFLRRLAGRSRGAERSAFPPCPLPSLL